MSASTRTAYRLVYREGRPVIECDGTPISPAAYCDCILWDREAWTARNRDFVESGVHLYFLTEKHNWDTFSTNFWTDEDVYPTPPADAFDLDAEVETILAMDPEARFVVRPGEMVPKTWQEKYPDEMQQSSTGMRGKQLSLASEVGRLHYGRYIAHVIRYCEGRPWAERIIGYMMFPFGEGLTELACAGLAFDVSPVMQRAFQAWTRERYPDEVALQAAWRNSDITFDTVAVPTEAEWKAKRERLLHFPDPAEVRRERDYFALQETLFRHYFRNFFAVARQALDGRQVLLGLDALKQPMLGWLLNQAFGRQDWIIDPMNDSPEMTLASGAIDVGDLLDESGWDIIITPSDYTARAVGFGWESEGINDSLRLRGKAMLVENDARTWMGGEAETQGAFLTPAEVRAGLLRNSAWALSRGHLHYWMNVGSSYFHDPRIHEVAIRDERRLLDASPAWPHVETEHAICLVLDDSSPRQENGTAGYQQLACLWQRHLGLAHCGVPYRVYLFSDLAKAEMPRYRTYLFPNLFELTEARMALLRRTVLRDGRVAIFGPATGITDGERLTAAPISRLLDMEFELVPSSVPRRVLVHGTHPLTDKLPAALTYGDSFAYGPVLIPTRAAVTAGGFAALGSSACFWGINKPGLLLKEFGVGAAGNGTPGPRGADDYALVWSVAVPLPANLLRECARYAGSNIWCEDDAVVLASDTVAALHTVKSGRHLLRFPTPRPVWDLLSGERVGENIFELALEMTAPETRVFYMGAGAPFAG
jgi:hypothetical protein